MINMDILEGCGDQTLQEDLEIIAAAQTIEWESMRNTTVLITGVTGLVGSQMVRALLAVNRIRGLQMRIIGIARSRDKVETIYGPLLSREDLVILYEDIMSGTFAEDVLASVSHVDYIIHGAAVTASRFMVEHPVQTIMTAIEGTQHLLDLGVQAGAGSFVYLSSMEAYGDMSIYGEGVLATEDRLGYVDPQRVRSDYPESKRMCENLCTAYCNEFGLPVRVARLSQTFGAGILPWEGRVFAQFARSAIEGSDIVLHTRGLSEGNYCYTRDVILGLLTILLAGMPGEAYNVVNEHTHMTIAQMAEVVSQTLGEGRTRVVFDIPEGNCYGYAADVQLHLDAGKLRGLGWTPTVDLPEMYQRLAASMRYHMEADV